MWRYRLVVVFYLCIVVSCPRLAMASEQSPFPALFAFGDSIVDSGNNNNFSTLIKCNFPPYGIDFERQKATGRFGNGRLPTDFLVEKFGIKKTLPAYLDQSLQEEDLLTGVSFASSGSGYDKMTSKLVDTNSLTVQLKWFSDYREKITAKIGAEKANLLVNNSLFAVVTGSCDIANTYYTVPFRRLFQDVDTYTNIMLRGATTFVQSLYAMGARTIAVCNVPPVGYLPSQRTLGGGVSRSVPNYYNRAAQVFNDKLKVTLEDLNTKLANSKIMYIDSYSIFLDIMVNSTDYGFEVVDKGCCGSGLIEAGPFCNNVSSLCNSKYLFFDSFHPSEAAYEILVDRLIQDYFPNYSS